LQNAIEGQIADAEAGTPLPMPVITQLSVYDEAVNRISDLFNAIPTRLIEVLKQNYAREIVEFEEEAELLGAEYSRIQKNIEEQKILGPANDRLTRHEADKLLFSGSPTAMQDAQNKLEDMQYGKDNTVELDARMAEIHDRLQSIQVERRAVAKQVFENWFAKVQPVVRAAEHGLFITLLDGLKQGFEQYQQDTNTGISNNRERPLRLQGYVADLTADVRSPEWAAGVRWYR
jgi:hypothetical protein